MTPLSSGRDVGIVASSDNVPFDLAIAAGLFTIGGDGTSTSATRRNRRGHARTQHRTILDILAITLVGAASVTGCGGGDSAGSSIAITLRVELPPQGNACDMRIPQATAARSMRKTAGSSTEIGCPSQTTLSGDHEPSVSQVAPLSSRCATTTTC
jgi:hypothetical protein